MRNEVLTDGQGEETHDAQCKEIEAAGTRTVFIRLGLVNGAVVAELRVGNVQSHNTSVGKLIKQDFQLSAGPHCCTSFNA